MTDSSRHEYDWRQWLSHTNMTDSDLTKCDWRRRLGDDDSVTTTPGTIHGDRYRKDILAAAKPEAVLYSVLEQIESKFQRLHPGFLALPIRRTQCRHASTLETHRLPSWSRLNFRHLVFSVSVDVSWRRYWVRRVELPRKPRYSLWSIGNYLFWNKRYNCFRLSATILCIGYRLLGFRLNLFQNTRYKYFRFGHIDFSCQVTYARRQMILHWR